MQITRPSRQDWFLFLLMLLLIPLAGEPKIHPFGGDFASFRVSFGSPLFLLFLLLLRSFPRMLLGCAAGIAVVLFRMALDTMRGIPVADAFSLRSATFFYYACYALFFAAPRLTGMHVYEQALAVAFWAILAEILASFSELTVLRMMIPIQTSFTFSMFFHILGIAILRCFFILSFFYIFTLYATEIRLARKTKERDRLALLIAGLYEETFTLRGAMQSAEDVTRDSYQAYDCLQEVTNVADARALSPEILRIAEQCHEIKKINQRIYTALHELTSNRRVDDYLPPDEIVRLLLHAQKHYACALGREITFFADVQKDLPPLHVFLLLSILNNLVANAVEAIPQRGTVSLSIRGGGGTLRITIENTGSFIAKDHFARVFHPGYTTKFDSSGKASSGVGLTYVKQKTESFGGRIGIDSDGKNRVTVSICLPCQKLQQQDAAASGKRPE